MFPTLFTLPVGAEADLLGYVGDLITDGWVLITLAIGIPLAFWVVNKVIGVITRRAK